MKYLKLFETWIHNIDNLEVGDEFTIDWDGLSNVVLVKIVGKDYYLSRIGMEEKEDSLVIFKTQLEQEGISNLKKKNKIRPAGEKSKIEKEATNSPKR